MVGSAGLRVTGDQLRVRVEEVTVAPATGEAMVGKPVGAMGWTVKFRVAKAPQLASAVPPAHPRTANWKAPAGREMRALGDAPAARVPEKTVRPVAVSKTRRSY